MTVIQSETSIEQSRLLGEFIKALDNLKGNVLEAARIYREATDRGVDLRRLCGKRVSLGFLARLDKISRGIFPAEIANHVAELPAPVIDVLATLPKDVQEQIVTDGLDIIQDGKPNRVRLDAMTAATFRKAVDATEGRGRVLSIEEQVARAEPAKVKHDKFVPLEKLRLTKEEYDELAYRAYKAEQPLIPYLKRQLYLTGILSKERRNAPAHG